MYGGTCLQWVLFTKTHVISIEICNRMCQEAHGSFQLFINNSSKIENWLLYCQINSNVYVLILLSITYLYFVSGKYTIENTAI